jgi:hypothetical protein
VRTLKVSRCTSIAVISSAMRSVVASHECFHIAGKARRKKQVSGACGKERSSRRVIVKLILSLPRRAARAVLDQILHWASLNESR